MAIEIERKFLVDTSLWRPEGEGTLYRQGYLSLDNERLVRVRIAGERAFLTVKGIPVELSRLEFEYAIPTADAAQMLDELCEKPLIEKTRHRETHQGWAWEIDVFHGENAGLLIAELELTNATDQFPQPAWAKIEVSGDPRYYNNNLVKNPYRNWK